MAQVRLLYVEDETNDLVQSLTSSFKSIGYEVTLAQSSELAMIALAERPYDVIVLDRKLPASVGDSPDVNVGDSLFTALNTEYPDVPLVVFTGLLSVTQMKLAHSGVNAIYLGEVSLQRIATFSKAEAIEAISHIRELYSSLSAIEAVEVDGLTESQRHDESSRRLLKRVAVSHRGARIVANSSDEGLSRSQVWLAQIYYGDGRLAAQVVIKTCEIDAPIPSVGFATVIPNSEAAVPHSRIQGCCRGRAAIVAPIAGDSPESLMSIIARESASQDPASAVRTKVVQTLAGIVSTVRQATIADALESVIRVELAKDIASREGLPPIPFDLPLSLSNSEIHGDLHPANILVVNDRPVFIDFDSQSTGSSLVDWLFLALGTYFHKTGAFRSDNFDPDTLAHAIHADRDSLPAWPRLVLNASPASQVSNREWCAVVLAYSLRQLRYPDVQEDTRLHALAIRLARTSLESLAES